MSSDATSALNIYRRVTTIRTIGGFDVDDAQYPDLYVRGGAIIKKTLWVYGDILGANIESLGNTTVGGDLLVLGESQFDGNVNIDGKLTANALCIAGNLSVIGKITADEVCSNTLQIFETSQFDGNVNIDAKLTVDDLCVSGTSTFDDLSTFNGNVIFNGNVVGISISGDITVDDITITNNATVNNKLTTAELCVSGTSTFDGNVIFNGNVTGISISGDITVDDITITNNATVGNGLDVTGLSQFDSNVNVDAKLTTDELCVNGNATVNGKLTVTGLIDPTGLVLDGQGVSPTTVTTGKGLIWVNTATPTELIFDDDTGNTHPIMFTDGSQAFTGNIDVGGFSIVNVNLVDGRDVSSDGATLDSHVANTDIHFVESSIDHGSISGLSDDDHTQYLLLAGRVGGQTITGNVTINNGAGNTMTTLTEFDTTSWSYNPKTPSHWNSGTPLTISEALDRLAANIAANVPL